MDKKNLTLGILFLVLAFGALFWSSRNQPAPARPTPVRTEPADPAQAPSLQPGEPVPGGVAAPATDGAAPAPAAAPRRRAPTILPVVGVATDGAPVLENAYIRVVFTRAGGAIAEVGMVARDARGRLQYAASKDGPEAPFRLNDRAAFPLLALLDVPGAGPETVYALVASDAESVVFEAPLEGGARVRRTYRINAAGDPYVIRHETAWIAPDGAVFEVPDAGLNLGTAQPAGPHDTGMYLSVGVHTGEDTEFTPRTAFETGAWKEWFGFGRRTVHATLEKPGPVVWAAVKNQYFATVATFDQPAGAVVAQRVQLGLAGSRTDVGVTGTVRLGRQTAAAGETSTLALSLYTGPKEYGRLAQFEQKQDRVMQFGIAPFFSKILLVSLNTVHDLLPNYGVAIILLTAVIKLVFWPLTAIAARSSKRMAKLAPLIKELQEKYKDNPQKAGREQMELFKKYKVNPLGGCLPILIQIPIFFGLFGMLQSASELRFAEFLWVRDLSQPDTVARIFGFPINILPILMTGTMLLQMHLAPTPTVDKMQARMFKIMPLIFCVFSYFFAAGLVLYWTVQNCFSILQQYLINRMPEPELELRAAEPANGPVAANAPVKLKRRK